MEAENGFRVLQGQQLPPDAFVRRSLAMLEFEFRRLSLCALSDWQSTGLHSDELFKAVANLARPSWGSWNGLLSALRRARNYHLRSGGPEQKSKIESASLLASVLALLDSRLAPDVGDSLQNLAQLCRANTGRPRFGDALTWPITLRNIIVHDAPTADTWWSSAADALRPLVEFLAHSDVVGITLGRQQPHEPWCILTGDSLAYFNGLTQDSTAARFVLSSGGQTMTTTSEADAGAVLLAVKQLMGRTDLQEQDFRKLLSRLAPDDLKGILLGDFLVGPPVADGGFATVHRGSQLSTGRRVAIKILRDGTDDELRARFRQEAEVLSRLSHPHIVTVLGYGEDTWQAPSGFSLGDEAWFRAFERSSRFRAFIALEWIEGETLESVYQRRKASQEPMPVDELLEYFQQAASALAAVHSIGWIHRDVKPSNLMIDERGALKLMDFGIARTNTESRTILTQTGQSFGTEPYMSPEQLAARDADAEVGPLTDIYSLCATFYELRTLRRIYDHDISSTAVVSGHKLRGDLPASLPSRDGKYAWEVSTLIMGGLRSDARLRPQTMLALEQDLHNLRQCLPIQYRRPNPVRLLILAYKRNRSLFRTVAGGMVLLVTVTAAFILYLDDARRAAEIAAADARAAGGEYAALCEAMSRAEDAATVDTILSSYTGEKYRARLEHRGELARARIREQETLGRSMEALARTKSVRDVNQLNLNGLAGLPEEWLQSRIAYFGEHQEITNTIGMRLIRIPAGAFAMGCEPGREDTMRNNIRRDVRISRDFYIGVFEVTNSQYRRFRAGHDSGSEKSPALDNDDHPVGNANWVDAWAFTEWLSEREGLRYRLPTEAEWEYVARCGRSFESSEYTWELAMGRPGGKHPGFPPQSPAANFAPGLPWSDSFEFTAPVGSFSANRWGVYDMGGNVWEWCWEWFVFSRTETLDPGRDEDVADVPPEGMGKILKGASFANGDRSALRIAQKTQMDHSTRSHNFGLRVLLEVPD